MYKFILSNSYFGLFLTLLAFAIGLCMQKKWKLPIFNPILVASALTMVVLVVLDIPVKEYQSGCAPLQYLLTPATICYAVGLYEQIGKLKKHLFAIVLGVFSGTLVSLLSIRLMCVAFGADKVMVATMLPKSITTAIGMALSEEAGGIASLTTAVIVLTGILGNVFGPVLCKLFRFADPIAQGVALGTASHAAGTSKATEISALAGAVSSLSLTFAGLITVVLYSFLI